MNTATTGFNTALLSALLAWLLAQCVKFIGRWQATGHMDFRALVATGGMPSSHSSLVSGLAAAVGLEAGFGSSVFAVAAVFASIVMFDAQSVRRAAGSQARILNQIVEELFEHHSLSDRKLAELLGHTPVEVFFGMALGIMTAVAVYGVSLNT